jgi:hypothetical protein
MKAKVMPLAAAAAVTVALGASSALADNGRHGHRLPRLSPAQPAALLGTCEALAGPLGALANTVITATTSIAAGTLTLAGVPVPAHCRVAGRMFDRVSPVDGKSYTINFEMRLPLAWNGRFWHQGNGGIDGAVVTATGTFGGGPTTGALMQGFAVLSSDAGHDNAQVGGPAFGIDPQARLDYGYQAVGKLTPIAKQTIGVAYGKGPDRSYFGGCSNGGRHTLVTAARYADQYDGYLAGAPGYNLPLAALANIFGGQRYASLLTADATGSPVTPAVLGTAYTLAERTAVSNAVLARCDALDGVTDGLIQDTRACQRAFNFMRDVPTCSGARDGTCLTPAQKIAIEPIYRGATTRNGERFYAGFPYDSGFGAGGIAFWEFTAPLALDSGAVGQIFKVPPVPAIPPTFSLDLDIDATLAQLFATDATYTESALQFMTPPQATQLNDVRARGAKMLVYHGVSDQIFSVKDTERWYRGVDHHSGGRAEQFVRLYEVPGMGHCSGGPATDQADFLTPLVQWVEQGVAPGSLTASARGVGNAGGVNADLPAAWAANRTRPLCPYPSVATYKGSGSVESASSFECRARHQHQHQHGHDRDDND